MHSFEIDPQSGEAPYEQVRRQIAAAVSAGLLAPGHKLPTVRAMATELGLATNTVARAYKELESDGLVQTSGRRGTHVTGRQASAPAGEAAAAYIATMRREGLSRDEAIRLVTEGWVR